MQNQWIGKKVLAQTNSWFVGPDGKDHCSVWGTLRGIYKDKDVLGFTINARATANWCYDFGDIIVMGCQINYLCLCPVKPSPDVQSISYKDGVVVKFTLPDKIYIANDSYPAE